MTVDEIERRVLKEVRDGLDAGDMRRVSYFSAIGQEIAENKEMWEGRIKDWVEANGKSFRPQGAGPLASMRKGDPREQDFTGWTLRGYQIDGKDVSVSTFKDMLIHLANWLRDRHGKAFDDAVLTFAGRKRRYFSKSKTALKAAYELDGGELFVETNLNANLIAQICFRMVDQFGHRFTIN